MVPYVVGCKDAYIALTEWAERVAMLVKKNGVWKEFKGAWVDNAPSVMFDGEGELHRQTIMSAMESDRHKGTRSKGKSARRRKNRAAK